LERSPATPVPGSIAERVRAAGVVGAGGGGFPTHVKLAGRANVVIANGAECEPLLHKDAACMEHDAPALVRGVLLAMEAVGAETGVIAVKRKNEHAAEAVRAAVSGAPVRLQLLEDYYPAGDEFDLVHEVTGRLIPAAGIPLDVGALVANVETLVNVAAAAEGRPVTEKLLTIAGAVKAPATFRVPVGTPLREVIALAGGPTVPDPVLAVGGLMMGATSDDLDQPVTKTTGGAIVLPRTHPVVRRKLTGGESQRKIGKAACDQCRYCTELCPRYLLGYAVEPHQVMRGLGFTAAGAAPFSPLAQLCCACGLCTLYACPEALFPKEACDDAKVELRRLGVKPDRSAPVKVHPLRDGRRVPIAALMRRLAVEQYAHPAPLSTATAAPATLRLPLRQGAGAANRPLVRAGDRVRARQPLGELPGDALGAVLHAPCDARIAAVGADELVLTREG
jgi:Na+-translocating ferredoxin:NAD+ oxidoreductase RnfC subunit